MKYDVKEHVEIHMQNVRSILPLLEQKFVDGYGKYNGLQHDEQYNNDIMHVLKEHVEPKMLIASNSDDNSIKADCIISAIGSLCALYGRITE